MSLADLSAELERLLRLRSNPIGMKLFESVDAMAAVPRIRRPDAVHTLDQIVAQESRPTTSWATSAARSSACARRTTSGCPAVR